MGKNHAAVDHANTRPCGEACQRAQLLLRAEVAGRLFWIAPGGGLDPGEDFATAAAREVAEDVGAPIELGPLVWLRRHVFEIDGESLDQRERFFVGWASSAAVAPAQPDRYVTGHRWWTLDELAHSGEIFAPRELPKLLATLLASYPETPIDVGR